MKLLFVAISLIHLSEQSVRMDTSMQGSFLPPNATQTPVVKTGRASCRCGVENVPGSGSRISGGDITAPNQFPWMVRLPGCGGSLISDRHILTAYHCIEHHLSANGNKNWGGYRVKVSVHDMDDPNNYRTVGVKTAKFPDETDVGSHDIAILVLTKKIQFEKTIQTVCLPHSENINYAGHSAKALGWGRYQLGNRGQSRYLRHVNLEVSRKSYGKNYLLTVVRKENGVVKEVCRGDSGGPLLYQNRYNKVWTIIGTVYGGHYDCATGSGLGGRSIWNKVTAHLDWIKNILAEDSRTTVCH